MTGASDVAPSCADQAGAWSPSTSSASSETIQVTFGGLFRVSTLAIYETYRAPFVTIVEGWMGHESPSVLWSGTDDTTCGGALDISIPGGSSPVDHIRITTTVSGYEQIDAVQMCGVLTAYPPSPPPSPPSPPMLPPPCDAQVDIALVLDNSGSVGAQRPRVIDFARQVVAAFTMGSASAQIAYVEFEATVVTHSGLTPSLTTITTALDNAPAIGGGTYLSGGIDAGQAAVTGAGARTGVPKVIILMSDGVQTVGGDDNTAIGAATTAKTAGTTIIAVGFGDVSLVTLNSMASSPSSQYAKYKATASELVNMLTNGDFGLCRTVFDLPRGPPPSPPEPPSPPAPPRLPPPSPQLPSSPPIDCNYCSDLFTAFESRSVQLIAAAACPAGAVEDTDAAGTNVCKMWVDGRMWFVPRE